MKFAHFFIDRPVFASVISIVTIICRRDRDVHAADRAVPGDRPADGRRHGQAIPAPTPRPSPRRIATPIEQQINGVENMLYMSSQCTNDGSAAADRHVRARHEPGHRPGAGAEPRRDRRAAAAGRRAPAGRHGRRSSPGHHARRAALLARTTGYDRLYLSNFATLQRPRRARAVARRRRRRTSSARATTRCGSGSIRRSWRPAT